MCARFGLPRDIQRLIDRFYKAPPPNLNWEPDPNLPPTAKAPILRSSSEGTAWEMARFGLVPFWQKTLKGAPSLHNARAETVRDKPAFRQSYAKRRCVIPAEGFYEWRTEEGRKMPYQFRRKDGELICFAGIWDFAEIENEKLFSFAMLTGAPGAIMTPFHDRMPLITDDTDAWLSGEMGVDNFRALPDGAFEIVPMDPSMNDARMKEVRERAEPPGDLFGDKRIRA